MRPTAHRNWSGNVDYGARRLLQPQSVEELQEVVAGASMLRPLGTRHSFNDIAGTSGDLVCLDRMPAVVSIDRSSATATVPAAMRYGELAARLHSAGFALHNLGSLPHISVAGACATGTHGSGLGNGNLATAVRAVELVRGDGEVVRLRRGRPEFGGAVLNLGALGVVTALTLDLQPAYEVRQDVYLNLPFARLQEDFAAVMAGAYSVSVFTDWRGAAADQVWVKRRVEDGPAPPTWLSATLAAGSRHPVPGQPPSNATEQLGVAGAWHERLPHFRPDFVPSNGRELQSEYLVPLGHGASAVAAMRRIGDRIAPLLLVAEIRTVAADNLWLSPCRGQDVAALHFTWVDDWPAVREVLPDVEHSLEPYEAVPHWGKLFTTPADEVRARYPLLPDFARLAAEHDPDRKLVNDFLRTYAL